MIQKSENNFILEKNDVKEIIPNRKSNTHKYSYGSVLVIAGSLEMPGAAALCSNAAIKMGAGLVTLVTPKIHPAIYPEVIVKSVLTPSGWFVTKNLEIIQQKIYKSNSIIIGPGITKNRTGKLVRELVLNNLDKNWIVDGDGIAAFNLDCKLSKNVILTPHLEEFLRLNKTGTMPIDILQNKQTLHNFAKKVADTMNCNILLKGSTTFITDGNISYCNEFGNPGMATAGSGDVLSGIIAANLAKQNKNITQTNFLNTVALSSLIHSLSGDYYAEQYDMETLTATDIINNLKNVIKEYKN